MRLKNPLSIDENGVAVTHLLFNSLHVPVTRLTLTKDLQEHPDYPSLLSISDVLYRYGVENLSLQTHMEKLPDLPTPFLVQVKPEKKGESKTFTLVREINGEGLTCFNFERNRWDLIDKETFTKRWTGIVLLPEVKEEAGEKDYKENLAKEKQRRMSTYLAILLLPALSVIAAMTAFLQSGRAAIAPVGFLLITLAGVFISALLLWYDLDKYNPLLQQICSTGKTINCGAVLESKGARIAGISWSLAGFTYFTGALLCLLVSGITDPKTLSILSWLNVLAVPYVIFSVFYQWKMVKQWCILCLGVQALLVGQFFIAFIGGWHTLSELSSPDAPHVLKMIVLFSISFAAASLQFQSLKKNKEGRQHRIALARLKHDPRIFGAVLQKQKMVTQNVQDLGITLGNPNAKHRIIKVCNPYCGPCAKAHPIVEDILKYNQDVQLQIIFFGSPNENGLKNKPIRHFLAIADRDGEAVTRKAMDDWYNSPAKDYAAFSEKYRLNGELILQNEKLDAMYNWCKSTEIAFTPTFFIDGYQLPDMYKIEDIKYLLAGE